MSYTAAETAAYFANIDLSETKQPILTRTTIAMPFLSLFFVLLRVVSRRYKRIVLGMDDYFLFAAQVMVFASAATNLAGIHYGVGLHEPRITSAEAFHMTETLFAYGAIYSLASILSKFAILSMYVRVMPVPSVRTGAIILASITTAWFLIFVPISIFRCHPIKKSWASDVNGQCLNLAAIFLSSSMINWMIDIFILALPLPQVWRLQTSTPNKISVCLIFLTGSFTVFAAVYRFATLFEMKDIDLTWTLANTSLWCVIEVTCAVISACLPTLRPLLRLATQKLGLSVSDTATTSNFNSRSTGTELRSRRNATRSLPGDGDDPVRPFVRLEHGQGMRPDADMIISESMCNGRTDSDSEEVLFKNSIVVTTDMKWKESHPGTSRHFV